jgi:hypothetical protein
MKRLIQKGLFYYNPTTFLASTILLSLLSTWSQDNL